MFIDIVIVIIFLFLILEGYIQGLMRSVIGLFGFIFSFVMGVLYYAPMSQYLQKHFEWFRMLKPRISDGLLSGLEQQIQSGVEQMAQNASEEIAKAGADAIAKNGGQMPGMLENSGAVQEFMKNNNVMDKFMESVNNFSASTNSGAASVDFMQSSADKIADGIVNGISFIIVVIGCMVVIKLIGMILDIATETPIIKQVNQFGGMIFGGVKAALLIFVMMMLAMYIGPLFPELKLISMIYESHIGVYFYEHNLLLIALNMYMGS